MSNKGILILLIVLVVIFGFVLACPTKEMHQTAVAKEVVSAVKADSLVENTGEAGLVSDAVLTKIVEAATANLVKVDNYFVLSLGYVNYQNDKRVVSIGVLHHVFCLFDKKDLENLDALGNAGGDTEGNTDTETE